MHLPPEVIERILYYADGKTLLKCKYISPEWNSIVKYLTKTTNIWLRCCEEDIPPDEWTSYVQKYASPSDISKYKNIYRNWYTWSDIKNNIDIAIQLSPVEISRISCLAIEDNLIAIGSEDGRIKLLNNRWNLLTTIRILASKVKKISFMKDKRAENGKKTKIYLLIAYNRMLVVTEFDQKITVLKRINDVNNHSVHNQYICCETFGGHINVSKLKKNPVLDDCFQEITTGRLYSPYEVTGLGLWEDWVTLILHDRIKRFKYTSSNPVTCLKDTLRLNVPVYDSDKILKCDILRDNIIIYRGFQHSISFYILDKPANSYVMKTFDAWCIFHATITAIFLYGSILVLGMDTGDVYFYNVERWEEFNLNKYAKKLIVTNYPIIKIDVKEIYSERRFYVATNFNVHELIGFTVKKPYVEYDDIK